MRYFSHFSVRFALLALVAVIFAIPALALAQVGYGGDGGGGGPSRAGTPSSVSFNPNPAVVVPTPALSETVAPTGGLVLGATTYRFTRTLQRGMTGEDVMALQKLLMEKGFMRVGEPTDFFGPLTEAAVRAFQAVNGLEPVGIVGPLTRSILNGDTPSPTSVDNTELIRQLQQQLQELLARVQALMAAQQQ